MNVQQECPLTKGKFITARRITQEVLGKVKNQSIGRMNVIWLEANGCSGNIISFMNSDNPGLYQVLTEIVNLTYENSLMAAEGEPAFQQLIDTLDTDFILVVEGAVSLRDNGRYNIIAYYNGTEITAYEAIMMAGERARYMIAVGTCASYGGISAASPNPSGCVSLQQVFPDRQVIKVPGCPTHPDWVVGTLAYLVGFGVPELDEQGRPLLFYGVTVHDGCTRRGFFDTGFFATKFGEDGCFFQIGCRGPVTRADCPRRKWNSYVNWPVGDNTNCIGCAQESFPDGMEPFIRF